MASSLLAWLGTLLGLGLMAPFWWLLPGLWLGWSFGGPLGRRGADRWLAALPLAFALPSLFLPVARIASLPWKEWWVGLSAVVAVVWIGRAALRRHVPSSRLAPAPLGVLAAVVLALIYALPMRGLAAPPGIDMSMHLTFARLLWQHAAVPLTQAPIFPEVPLGAYPLGFHALVALTALGTGNVLVAGLLVTAATHAFTAIALYLCCRRPVAPDDHRLDLGTAVASLAIAWIARNPQTYVSWGGNPCVLGSLLALVAARALLLPASGDRGVAAIEAGLLAAAVALVHPTPAALLAYVMVLALPTLAALGHVKIDKPRFQHLALAGAVAAVVLLPQLPAMVAMHLAPQEAAWVREHHRVPPQAPEPGLAGDLRYLNGQYGDTLVLLFAALLVAGAVQRGRRRLAVVHAAALVMLLVLASLAADWRLPPAMALYPERMMLFGLPLFVLALRGVFGFWSGLARAASPVRRAAAVVLALLLAGVAVAKHQQFYQRKVRDDAFVTAADARAFAWLARQAAPGDVVDNNFGDAGVYIPAAIGLAVTRPQLNPIWFDEMAVFQARVHARWRYHGAYRIAADDLTEALISPTDVTRVESGPRGAATVARVPGIPRDEAP